MIIIGYIEALLKRLGVSDAEQKPAPPRHTKLCVDNLFGNLLHGVIYATTRRVRSTAAEAAAEPPVCTAYKIMQIIGQNCTNGQVHADGQMGRWADGQMGNARYSRSRLIIELQMWLTVGSSRQQLMLQMVSMELQVAFTPLLSHYHPLSQSLMGSSALGFPGFCCRLDKKNSN